MTSEKQRKTFLSYSRVNWDFAVRLAKELKLEGFDIWVDQLDIPAGARWDREVEKALQESDIFMIILTTASVDSENVLDEIGYAIDNSKRFLPVLLEPCNVPLRLRRFQYVDFTNKGFDEGVESAKELLRSLIAQPTIPRGVVVADLQAEAERKVNEEDEKSPRQNAEEKQLVQAEADRKAKEESNRLAAKRAEEERLVGEKVEEERVAKERVEADRLVSQKVEQEGIAKTEADRKAEDEVERKTKESAERKSRLVRQQASVPVTTSLKKSISMGLVAGIAVFVVLCVVGIGLGMNVLASLDSPAVNVQEIPPSTTKLNGANTLQPTTTQRPTNTPRPSSTPIPMPVILSRSDAQAVLDSGEGISLVQLAQEQLGEDKYSTLYGNSERIPVVLDSSGPTLSSPGAWCSLNADILQENLDHIAFWFNFVGSAVPEKNILYDSFTYDDGWECLRWYIVIDNWTTGIYLLDYGYSVDQAISDGESDYEPGYGNALYLEVTIP